MNVFIGYRGHYDNCESRRVVEKIFDDEVKALLWVEEANFANPDFDWREYEVHEVE
jgi:hypothetical protein